MSESVAQKIKAMFVIEDKSVMKQAVALITSLDRFDLELQRDFLEVFADALYDPDRDHPEAHDTTSDTGLATLRETQHNVHSLCHSERLHQIVWDQTSLDDPLFYTINAAWALSYVCGLWDRWESRGERFPISAHDYVHGELEGSSLLDLLKGKHVHILSPLDPTVLKMIAALTEVGVASIKLDSLCDEYFGELITVGEQALGLMELGAERAVLHAAPHSIVRTEPIYTRWVSTVINRHKLKGQLAQRWRFVCLRAAVAKTVTIKPEEDRWSPTQFKMVYCPVKSEASKGLWVARTLHCSDIDTPVNERFEPGHYTTYEVDKTAVDQLPYQFNSWSRSKRYTIPYRVNEDDKFDNLSLDLGTKSFRLATHQELMEIGYAGDDRQEYSGVTSSLHLHTLEDADCEDHLALHSSNAWGIYDLGALEEYVWDEDYDDRYIWGEYFCEFVRAYGGQNECKIDQKTQDPERLSSYYTQGEFAFRPVLPA